MDILEQNLQIPTAGIVLKADAIVPGDARGVVLFVPGGGSWFRRRSRHVAGQMCDAGLGVVLAELITPNEAERGTIELDGGPLASRAAALIDWVTRYPYAEGLGVGVYGTSTAVAPVLAAAAALPGKVQAVAVRGGRPDLAGQQLNRVYQPTLLIVGGDDAPALPRARETLGRLHGEARLKIVPGASHLFDEPGVLEQAAFLACEWFLLHLRPVARTPAHH
ncbi:MAG: dienelactone hydrolase family protein [Actinoallomurus sp.]